MLLFGNNYSEREREGEGEGEMEKEGGGEWGREEETKHVLKCLTALHTL